MEELEKIGENFTKIFCNILYRISTKVWDPLRKERVQTRSPPPPLDLPDLSGRLYDEPFAIFRNIFYFR